MLTSHLDCTPMPALMPHHSLCPSNQILVTLQNLVIVKFVYTAQPLGQAQPERLIQTTAVFGDFPLALSKVL